MLEKAYCYRVGSLRCKAVSRERRSIIRMYLTRNKGMYIYESTSNVGNIFGYDIESNIYNDGSLAFL